MMCLIRHAVRRVQSDWSCWVKGVPAWTDLMPTIRSLTGPALLYEPVQPICCNASQHQDEHGRHRQSINQSVSAAADGGAPSPNGHVVDHTDSGAVTAPNGAPGSPVSTPPAEDQSSAAATAASVAHNDSAGAQRQDPKGIPAEVAAAACADPATFTVPSPFESSAEAARAESAAASPQRQVGAMPSQHGFNPLYNAPSWAASTLSNPLFEDVPSAGPPPPTSEADEPHLEAIFVYPIKSCAGFSPSAWPIGPNGLLYDREWALVDESGVALTQRRLPKLVTLRPRLDIPAGELCAVQLAFLSSPNHSSWQAIMP